MNFIRRNGMAYYIIIMLGMPQALQSALTADMIISAKYGADWRQKDVTSLIKSNVGKAIPVTNDFFQGDPASGTVKQLVITYKDPVGNQKNMQFNEGSSAILDLPAVDSQVAASMIIKATYGADSGQTDVTGIIKSNMGSSIPVTNDFFHGDPAQNMVKRLIITYKDAAGNQKNAPFIEGNDAVLTLENFASRSENSFNNISFVNDSDKTVYICRDRDDQGAVAPKAAQCFGPEFFKDATGTPSPRYFKISFSKKSCSDTPDTKYALAPNRNYRITTTAALKTEEPWFGGCPPLTLDQQAREQKTGGILTPVTSGLAVLGDDIKSGAIKGFDATSNFFTQTTPAAVQDAYNKTATYISQNAVGGFSSVSQGVSAIGSGLKSAAESVGRALNPSNW